MDSIVNLLAANITVGAGDPIAVGDGTDPNHEPPYLIVKQVSSFSYEGPMDDIDADEELRVQVIGFGDTRESADWARDQARTYLTKTLLNAQFATDSVARKAMRVELDLSRLDRFDRTEATAIYNAIDQYIVHTTPS